MKLIERRDYLQALTDCMNTPDIKVITGIRRSGKSMLMDYFGRKIGEMDAVSNVIHVNFNLTEYENLLEYHKLEQYIEDHYLAGKNNYVLIDEVQMCDGFEKAINSLNEKMRYDIYVTGSNAFLQSSDLATLFVGRTFEIQIYPFSFSEYLAYFPQENIYRALTDYLRVGGMSGSYVYRNPAQRSAYLNNDVLNALIVRDIESKYKIRNPVLLNSLIDYLMDNIGNLTSIRSIADTLESRNMKADHKTVGRYIEYLCRSYLFCKVKRYDIRGKKYLSSEEKYYLTDHAFRYARLGTRYMDFGRILENAVAIELLRRKYEEYAGVLYKKEIDFVAVRENRRVYIQVANDISDPSTFDRETEPLLKISDGYPRILIARTWQPETDYQGIHIIDAAEWLSNPHNRRIDNIGE
ncbi:MAG: ATP-binding protein [Bilifractor sp.]|jgi:predicted AAA+ superfamily ATPase